MNEIIINFALIVVASLYCGVLIGKRGVRKEVEKAVNRTLDQAREKERELATELHGELGKIREGIIASARAYQNAVRAVEEKLAPPSAFTLGDMAIEKLPETLDSRSSAEPPHVEGHKSIVRDSSPYSIGPIPAEASDSSSSASPEFESVEPAEGVPLEIERASENSDDSTLEPVLTTSPETEEGDSPHVSDGVHTNGTSRIVN